MAPAGFGNVGSFARSSKACACPSTADDVLHDHDVDGIPDATESVLGTDPHDPDTDGDATPDGTDACPLARPGTGDEAAVVAEVVRYAARLYGGVDPLEVRTRLEHSVEVPGAPTLLLHRVVDQVTPGWFGGAVRVSAVRVDGAEASATIMWEGAQPMDTRTLRLRPVDGTFRVVGDDLTRWFVD